MLEVRDGARAPACVGFRYFVESARGFRITRIAAFRAIFREIREIREVGVVMVIVVVAVMWQVVDIRKDNGFW